MNTRLLGSWGPRVSAIGLGCMAMSGSYGPAEEEESMATIRAALDAGITLLDTGDFYGMGHNGMLICQALRNVDRENVVLSVKFGALRDPLGGWSGYDCRPEAVKNFLAYSLKRLGVDYIDIYRPARLDRAVPIEDTVGAMAEMVKAGCVRYVGLSEVNAETIRRAVAVHPICDLQIEYSLLSRGIERRILPFCRDLGIGVTAYGVLSRGLISGHWSKEQSATDPRRDSRASLRRTWSAILPSLRHSGRWRTRKPSVRRRSPSPGLRLRGRTSCPSSARVRGCVSWILSVRVTLRGLLPIWLGSRQRCHQGLGPGSGTRPR